MNKPKPTGIFLIAIWLSLGMYSCQSRRIQPKGLELLLQVSDIFKEITDENIKSPGHLEQLKKLERELESEYKNNTVDDVFNRRFTQILKVSRLTFNWLKHNDKNIEKKLILETQKFPGVPAFKSGDSVIVYVSVSLAQEQISLGQYCKGQ